MGSRAYIGTVGVAGCGTMGRPMLENLINSSVDAWGFDTRPLADFGKVGARMIEDATQFSANCDTVISVVRDWQETLDLCFDDQAIFNKRNYPDRLIISSTLSPRLIADLRTRLPEDVDLIDAPMSGAPFRAEEGNLTFMVGGEEKSIAACQPLFDIMGAKTHHLGPLCSGMTCKVLNNLLAATSVVTVRRVMQDAEKLGLSASKLLEVSSQSSGATWFGDHFEQIAWGREGYSPTNTIGILEKDVKSMMDAVSDYPDLTKDGFEDAVLDALRGLKPLSSS